MKHVLKHKWILLLLIFTMACSRESENIHQEDEIISDNLVSLKGQVDFTYTQSNELLAEFTRHNGEKYGIIVRDVDHNQIVESFNGQNVRLIYSGRNLMFDNQIEKFVITVGWNVIKKDIADGDPNAAVQNLQDEGFDIVNQIDVVRGKGFHIISGGLNLPEGFEEDYNSVFDYRYKDFQEYTRTEDPECFFGGFGETQCGFQSFFSNPTVCAPGFYCCAKWSWSDPECLPCGQWIDHGIYHNVDPCTGQPVTGGGNGNNGGSNDNGGSSNPENDCLYIIDIFYFDENGDLQVDTWFVWGPC